MERRGVADEIAEERAADRRGDDAGGGRNAADRALQDALLVGRHRAGDDRLRGGTGQAPAEDVRHRHRVEHPPLRDEGEHRHADGGDGEAEDHRRPFAEARHGIADEDALREDEEDADPGKGDADLRRAPAELVAGEQHPGALQQPLGELRQHEDDEERDHRAVAGDDQKGADRVRLPQPERTAVLAIERFGQQEEGEEEGDEADAGGGVERHARAVFAKDAADQRAGDEADAEGDADDAEVLRTALGRRDVGDVGAGGRDRGAHDAADDARQRHHPEVRRDRHQQVVEPEAEHGKEQDRPAAEAVGKRAHRRTEEELHQRIERDQPAVDHRRRADIAAVEVAHQPGHHRQHDADAEDIDDEREEEDGELDRLRHLGPVLRPRRGSGDPPRRGLRR